MAMMVADARRDGKTATTYRRGYWRLWNAPYSAHASGATYTRTHLIAVTGEYEVALTSLCGQRHDDHYHADDRQGWRGVCKRCRSIAERRGMHEA